MSLIHWWPLTEDLKDKVGGNDFRFLSGYNNGFVQANAAGKLGACYEKTAVGKADFLRSTEVIGPFAEESICGWFYVTEHAALGTANGLVTHHDHNANSGLGIGVYTSDGINYYTSINAGTGSSRIHSNSAYRGSTNIKGAWHHICLTYAEDGNFRMYVDGKEDMVARSYALYNQASYFDLFNWSTSHYTSSNYRPACKMNDIRIYDHALSQAEVKELSRAMVVHYSFDDNTAEGTTNVNTPSWSAYSEYWTISSQTMESISLYRHTGSTSQTVALSNSSIQKNFVAGDTWTVSCYLYKNGKPHKSSSSYSSSYKSFTQIINYESREDGYFRVTFTLRNNDNDALDSWILHAPLFGTVEENVPCEIRYLQFEKKNHATFYTDSSRTDQLYNESGLAQPTLVTNYAIVADSAMGSYSLNCNGATMIDTPSSGDFSTGATASLWVKTPSYPEANAIVFVDSNSKLAFGFYGTQAAIVSGGGYSSIVINNLKSSWKEGWNHIVVTRDAAGTISCWLNGSKLSGSGSNNWFASDGKCTVGGRYNGSYQTYSACYISDFRLYYTLLTETEINDLYKVRALVTDNGDIMCRDFIDDRSIAQVTNQSIFQAKEFREGVNEEYQRLEYIQSTGNQYIDTKYYWLNEKATIIADLMIDSNASNQTVFGNEERYSGSNRYFAHILHGNNGNFSNYIGTGSAGTTTQLPIGNRYVIEYIAHGDNTFTTRRTATDGSITTFANKTAYNGTILTKQHTTSTTANAGNIFIFSNHNGYNGTGPIQNIGGMKLYRFTMIDNDKYVRDFVPCKRISDETTGLFDLITREFYTSPKGTNFVTGSNLPDKEMMILSDQTVTGRNLIEF